MIKDILNKKTEIALIFSVNENIFFFVQTI